MRNFDYQTPSLHNVSRTKPFGHSGSIFSLNDAVQAHYGPLAFFEFKTSTTSERFEFLKYIQKHDAVENTDALTKGELEQLITFLNTLEFRINE